MVNFSLRALRRFAELIEEMRETCGYAAPNAGMTMELIGCHSFVIKTGGDQRVKVLPAKLASERAWQVYCLINPAAQKRVGLKADLDSYLSKLEVVDSSTLVVDGLKYLKSLEQLEGKIFRTAPLATLGT